MVLQNLYRLQAIGYDYIDPIVINHKNAGDLPSDLNAMAHLISQCHLCDLSKSRTQSMSGIGNPQAKLMIVDAYVSIAEDESNQYFSGRSGLTLQKMVENVLQIPLEDVFYTHGVKCKPLGAKQPSNSEIQSCKPYLFKQIEIIKPHIIIALGEDAYRLLTADTTSFDKIRGQKIQFGDQQVVPIYHPAYLLRNPSQKKITQYDLEMIKGLL